MEIFYHTALWKQTETEILMVPIQKSALREREMVAERDWEREKILTLLVMSTGIIFLNAGKKHYLSE